MINVVWNSPNIVSLAAGFLAAGDLVGMRGKIKRRKAGAWVTLRAIQRLAKKLKVNYPLLGTLEDAETKYKEALNAYQVLKPNAPVLHPQFLLSCLDDENQPVENQ